jgi:hypothetical protein
LDAILAFLKKVYQHKEKIILGILVLAFIGVAVTQLRVKKNTDSPGGGNDNPTRIIDGWKPAPRRQPQSYKIESLNNPYPLATYVKLAEKKNIFEKPQKSEAAKQGKEAEWASIKVKSVFDPTQSGSYIAIIEVDKRSRIVKEGQQFEGYEVRRIDGVRGCLSITKRGTDEEKEFCKEE